MSRSTPLAMTTPRHKLWAAIAIAALAIVAVFSASSPANAATPENKMASLARQLERSADTASVLAPSAAERQKLVALAMNSNANRGDAVLAPESAEFYTLTGNEVVVAIPAANDDLAYGSGLITFLDTRLSVDLTLEVEYRQLGDGGAEVKAWIDGDELVNSTLTAEQLQPALGAPDVQAKAAKSYWDQLSACLASKGLPGTILAVAGTLCAVSCAITAGAMCLVCLGGLMVGYGTMVTACVNEVNAGKWK